MKSRAGIIRILLGIVPLPPRFIADATFRNSRSGPVRRFRTYFFVKTMRVPNFRPTPFVKSPKSALARLF